jgi:DNA-directed RNA polymerase II subunit RPB9
MVYGCRICQYDEMVDNSCVYRNDLLTVTKCVFFTLHSFRSSLTAFREQVGVTTDLGADATLVRLRGFHIFDLSLMLIPCN